MNRPIFISRLDLSGNRIIFTKLAILEFEDLTAEIPAPRGFLLTPVKTSSQ